MKILKFVGHYRLFAYDTFNWVFAFETQPASLMLSDAQVMHYRWKIAQINGVGGQNMGLLQLSQIYRQR